MTEKLTSILKAEGLDHLLNNFTDQGVTDSILGDLSDADLKDLGVEKLGERKRLLAAFKGSAPAQSVSSVASQPVAAGATSTTLKTATSPAEATMDAPFVNTLGMPFVPIPRFDTRFCIWPVRVQDFEAYCLATGSTFPECPFTQGGDHPIVGVTWNESMAFCEWLTAKERIEGRIGSNEAYTLPTDLEWSAAVGLPPEEQNTPAERHLKLSGYPWGLRWPPPKNAGNYEPKRVDQLGFLAMANAAAHDATISFRSDQDSDDCGIRIGGSIITRSYKQIATALKGYYKTWITDWMHSVDDYEFTSPVGAFTKNHFGIFDLGGNVWEWCFDPWDNTNESFRTLRGGSYATHRFAGNNDYCKIIQKHLIMDGCDKLLFDIGPSELEKKWKSWYFQDGGTKWHGPITNKLVYQSSFRFGAFESWRIDSNFESSENWTDYPIAGFRLVLTKSFHERKIPTPEEKKRNNIKKILTDLSVKNLSFLKMTPLIENGSLVSTVIDEIVQKILEVRMESETDEDKEDLDQLLVNVAYKFENPNDSLGEQEICYRLAYLYYKQNGEQLPGWEAQILDDIYECMIECGNRDKEKLAFCREFSRKSEYTQARLLYDHACLECLASNIDKAKELLVEFFSLPTLLLIEERKEKESEACFEGRVNYALEDDDLTDLRNFLSELNDPNVQFEIGKKYQNGTDCEQNHEKAAHWYRLAILKDQVKALNNLSGLLKTKKIKPVSDEKWKDLEDRAAYLGNRVTQYVVGLDFYKGNNREKNEKVGLEWMQKSADQGFDLAIEFLKNIRSQNGGFFSFLKKN